VRGRRAGEHRRTGDGAGEIAHADDQGRANGLSAASPAWNSRPGTAAVPFGRANFPDSRSFSTATHRRRPPMDSVPATATVLGRLQHRRALWRAAKKPLDGAEDLDEPIVSARERCSAHAAGLSRSSAALVTTASSLLNSSSSTLRTAAPRGPSAGTMRQT